MSMPPADVWQGRKNVWWLAGTYCPTVAPPGQTTRATIRPVAVARTSVPRSGTPCSM